MRAHILSIGSELMLGYLTDTNATFLARDLAARGIELVHVTHVGDDLPRMVRTFKAALTDADLVIATGGVGPTDDDLTREAIARVVGQTPEVDATLLAEIEAFFAARGAMMPARNAKQAWLIPSAEPLPNPVGTAPGWFVRQEGRVIVAMPGVPREMYRMWAEQAVPQLEPLLPQRSVQSVTFRTMGIGESAAEELLRDLVERGDPVVATYAKDDGVHVRVTATGVSAQAALARLQEAADEVETRLRRHVYAHDDAPLPRILLRLLREHGLTIGVAEQGTGGRFNALLGSDQGAADVLCGGVATPASRSDAPNMDAGALALSAVERFGADIGLGLAAVLTLDGPQVYRGEIDIALAGAFSRQQRVPTRASFEDVQRRAALAAADLLRRAVGGID
ncbi:MAG: CinA family nicotinamide mononucleotide deamidase-related protein [Chloroflexota bacterium]|nr:CinA family nicotinamide mononucleotide deamidase-related protein [Chloroflexota bacterium]